MLGKKYMIADNIKEEHKDNPIILLQVNDLSKGEKDSINYIGEITHEDPLQIGF